MVYACPLDLLISLGSYLFLVVLHRGHCRATLLPFGTVGNGRFGPGFGPPGGRQVFLRETRRTTCQFPAANAYVFRATSGRVPVGGCCPESKGPETLSQRDGGAPIDHVLVPREEYDRFLLSEPRPAREVVLPAPLRSLPASRALAAAAG
jgi:hypothetical protein